MVLVLPIFGVLMFSVASGLRICSDCVNILDCAQAMDLKGSKYGLDGAAMLDYARCSIGGSSEWNVCCSDLKSVQEIVYHTNRHLLPDDCHQNRGISKLSWLVKIYQEDERRLACTGSLINSRYVLTTATCISQQKVMKVRICVAKDFNHHCQDIDVTDRSVPEAYKQAPTLLNNIGLLRLKTPVNITSDAISLPIRLGDWSFDPTNDIGFAVIWPDIPGRRTCMAIFERFQERDLKRQIESRPCARPSFFINLCNETLGSAVCYAPSGFDKEARLVQYGIFSMVPSICRDGTSKLYTDVRPHMKWILDTIKE